MKRRKNEDQGAQEAKHGEVPPPPAGGGGVARSRGGDCPGTGGAGHDRVRGVRSSADDKQSRLQFLAVAEELLVRDLPTEVGPVAYGRHNRQGLNLEAVRTGAEDIL